MSAPHDPNDPNDVLDPRERLEIVDTCIRMGHHTDRREWDRLVEVFADEVRLDYTSLQSGEPATMAREQLVDGWRSALGGLAAIHHPTTNHLVDADGDQAVCTADFQATHVLPNSYGDPTWTLGGHYRFELRRIARAWRITEVTMTAIWGAGNQQILALASAAGTSTTEEPR